ncbi:MAG: hypothetical protein PHN51_10200 [Candidatus Nanopelagicales bacterium]|nr:hypothetical protein [Candidatus Nanopelagicales bacterium]
MTPIYKVSDIFTETEDEARGVTLLYREKPITTQSSTVLHLLLKIRPGSTDNPELMSRVARVINTELDRRAMLTDEAGLIFLKAAIVSEIQSGTLLCLNPDACVKTLEEWTRNWDVSYDGGDYECRLPQDPTAVMYLTARTPATKVPTAKLCFWNKQMTDTWVLLEGPADYVVRQITELGVPALKAIYRNNIGLPSNPPLQSR